MHPWYRTHGPPRDTPYEKTLNLTGRSPRLDRPTPRRLRGMAASIVASILPWAGTVSADEEAADSVISTAAWIESFTRALETPPGICSFGEDEELSPIELRLNDRIEEQALALETRLPGVDRAPE